MKTNIYEIDGRLVGSVDDLNVGDEIDVPTHGSISIEIAPGVWLNAITSEWLDVKISNRPKTWKDM